MSTQLYDVSTGEAIYPVIEPIPVATTAINGLLSSTDKTKLDQTLTESEIIALIESYISSLQISQQQSERVIANALARHEQAIIELQNT
jgi:hypothetical protein